MGMHFKLGLYEHQSAGALQGLIDLLEMYPALLEDAGGTRISRIVVRAYEPAFGIIGDPHKRDPHTRQSADHSMLYLVCTMLRKALGLAAESPGRKLGWRDVMLLPEDFTQEAIHDPLTRSLMERMAFEHGGAEYDAKYPDGIPTSIVITDHEGNARDSGLVMYPAGHARNTTADLYGILGTKFTRLASLATDDPADLIGRLSDVNSKSVRDMASLYDFTIGRRETE
jgi:2-methylcitrate dehydratase